MTMGVDLTETNDGPARNRVAGWMGMKVEGRISASSEGKVLSRLC